MRPLSIFANNIKIPLFLYFVTPWRCVTSKTRNIGVFNQISEISAKLFLILKNSGRFFSKRLSQWFILLRVWFPSAACPANEHSAWNVLTRSLVNSGKNADKSALQLLGSRNPSVFCYFYSTPENLKSHHFKAPKTRFFIANFQTIQ